MSVKKASGLILIIFMAGTVQSISVSVADSCGSEEVSAISLNKTDGGHIGEPGVYPNKVCIDGIEYTEIRENCQSDEQLLFSMEAKNNSHLTVYNNEYNYKLCTPRYRSSVRDSCLSNQTKMLSVTSDNNTHAAAPTYSDSAFDKSLCLQMTSPDNMTITLSGLSDPVYSDGAVLNPGDSITPPIDYPYIVDDQPKGLVGYGQILQLSRPSSSEGSITQMVDTGGVLIPFTKGGEDEIRDEEELITEKQFLNTISPNFGFANKDEPTVKVQYKPSYNLNGFNGQIGSGNNKLRFENEGLQEQELLINIETR